MMSPVKIIRQICSVLLLAVFLFGITGMSLYRHACLSSKTLEVTAYPEFVSGQGDECCPTEGAGYQSAPRDRFQAGAPLSVDEPSCCKTSRIVLRLEFFSLTLEKAVVPAVTAEAGLLTEDPRLSVVSGSGFPTISGGYHAPPGKAGKQLVLFLSQPKVPRS